MQINSQLTFILREIFAATLGATVQRSKTYADNASEANRGTFQKSLQKNLERLSETYKSQVSEAQHLANIEALADGLSAEHATVLYKSRFRIGSAQKALNLYLKYRWCLGLIECPPHCPIDAKVLSKLPGCASITWTTLDSMSEYQKIISEARLVAGNDSLPVWELKLWNNT
jgi:hypothetical protein